MEWVMEQLAELRAESGELLEEEIAKLEFACQREAINWLKTRGFHVYRDHLRPLAAEVPRWRRRVNLELVTTSEIEEMENMRMLSVFTDEFLKDRVLFLEVLAEKKPRLAKELLSEIKVIKRLLCCRSNGKSCFRNDKFIFKLK